MMEGSARQQQKNISAVLEKRKRKCRQKTSMGPNIHENKTIDRTCDLCDWFHEKKRPKERLRSLKLLPDLASTVNSVSAQEIYKELSTNRNILGQLEDLHYMFPLWLYFHLHNQRINSMFLWDIQRISNKDVHLGRHGHLLIGVDEETDKGTTTNVINILRLNNVSYVIAKMYQRTSAKSLTEPQAEPGVDEEDLESSLFPFKEVSLKESSC